MRIKKGDNVIVISGKDKGKTGKVLRALPQEGKVIVEGVYMKKKHQKAKKSNQKGQIIDITLPVPVSNVMLVDKSGKRTRVGYRFLGESTSRRKVRYAKKAELFSTNVYGIP